MDAVTTTPEAVATGEQESSFSSPSARELRSSPTRKGRREEDLSYLERPKILIQNHPPQAPLNNRFARPNTRRNASPDTKQYGLLERDRKRRRRSGETGARPSSSRLEELGGSESDGFSSTSSMDVVDQGQRQEQHAQQHGLERTKAPAEGESAKAKAKAKAKVSKVTAQEERSSTPEPSNPSAVESVVAETAASESDPKLIQEDFMQDMFKDSTNASTTDNNIDASEKPSTMTESTPQRLLAPSLTTTADSAKIARITDTGMAPPMPAQVTSVMQASPSRRVVFSPDKQESCLSIPNNTNIPKLKGILKTTVKPVGKLDLSKMVMPTDEEIASNRPVVKRKPKLVQKSISTRMLEARFSGNKSKIPEQPFTDSPFLGSNSALTFAASPAKVLDPLIRNSIEKLKAEDLAVRKETYDSMLNILRSSKDKTYYDEIQESIRPLTARILIDLDHGNTETAVTLSVHRCLAFLFFERPIAQLFTDKEMTRLLGFVLRVADTSNNKTLVNVSLCCLGTCMVPMKILAPYCEQIIKSIANHLNSRLNSTSATNEAILNLIAFLMNHPEEIVPSAQAWLSPLLLLLVHDVPGIRKKALESIQALIPTFLQTDDNRLRMAAVTFMNEHGDQFVQKLDAEHLKAAHEVFALRIWGTLVIVLGKDLHRHPMLNPMLKIVEIAFNRGVGKNNDAKITAFKSWTRLIYNFSRGGHLHSEKTRKLIFRPIAKGLAAINHNRARLAATNAWMALIYGLGPELVKNADEVFFPIVRPLVTDESEHIRDLILRLLAAMFSNTGGAELLEGSQFIAPGSISFADLGMSEAHWVRTSLLGEGLECLFLTMHLQYKITDASREEWRMSSITGLPFLTQPCSRLWESIVRAVRDINYHEKGLKSTAEAESAVSSLLYFIDRVSKSVPSSLVPGDWPDRDNGDIKKLQADPEKAGFIIRGDIVHYLYSAVVEIMSVKTLVATRYKMQDTMHADIFDALEQDAANTGSTTRITQVAEPRDITMSPMDFILKSWLALGESVQGSLFEAPFWQATSTLVDWSASSLQALRALYRCIGHLDDIKAKRQTTSPVVWPAVSHGPISLLAFRDFEIKYWSIVAVRLTNSISTVNEITEAHSPGANSGYEDLFMVLLFPLSILHGPSKEKIDNFRDVHSQRTHDSQDEYTLMQEVHFLEKRAHICLPVWVSLVKNFYRIAQHKRGRANAVLNALAVRIQKCYDLNVPYVWMQPMTVGFASHLVDTLILADPKATLNTPLGRGAYYGLDASRSQTKQQAENVDGLLQLCIMLVEQAYRGIQLTKDLEEDPAKVPAIQESAILLLEKVINKAPTSLVIQWIKQLHRAILLWLSDSGHAIRDLPKDIRQAYQTRIETLWNDCILHRLLSCAIESKENGAKSGFGSVMEPPSTTIRGAFERAQVSRSGGSGLGSKSEAGAGLLSRSSSSSSITSGTSHGENVTGPFTIEDLSRLSPLLVAALISGRKAMVNKTLEFWNETFGTSQVDLVYPPALVEAMRPLKLVATVSLPGWKFEDSSQTEVPQFSASMSQEALLSVPAELNVRVSASKLMKQKAELAVMSSTSSPTSSPRTNAAVTPSPAKKKIRRTRIISDELDDDFECEKEMVGREDRTPTKRKRSKIIHTLEMDPINKSLVGKSSEKSRRSLSPDGGSSDEAEASTPTKKPVQKVPSPGKKEQRPAPPVWRLQPPLEPYDPAKDPSSSPTTSSPVISTFTTTPAAAIDAAAATTALESVATTSMEAVHALGEDHRYASVSPSYSGGSAVSSPQASNSITHIALGTESEATTMDMSQQADQGVEPLESEKMDVDVEEPTEVILVEDSKDAIVVSNPAESHEDTPTESIAVEKPVMAVEEGVAETTVGRGLIAIEGLLRVAKVERDGDEKSLSLLSQQGSSSKSENLVESKSLEQDQDQEKEKESKSRDQTSEVAVEVKRRRGRPSHSAYSSYSPASASASASASPSPDDKGELKRKRVARGVSSVSASPSASPSASTRNGSGASDYENYLENGEGGSEVGEGTDVTGHGPSAEQAGPIEDCLEFMTALRRVEDASGLLRKLDSRQLLEVQNRIIALNQA
ncbi:DNA-binding protein rif1, partial [Mortierella sp. AD032]